MSIVPETAPDEALYTQAVWLRLAAMGKVIGHAFEAIEDYSRTDDAGYPSLKVDTADWDKSSAAALKESCSRSVSSVNLPIRRLNLRGEEGAHRVHGDLADQLAQIDVEHHVVAEEEVDLHSYGQRDLEGLVGAGAVAHISIADGAAVLNPSGSHALARDRPDNQRPVRCVGSLDPAVREHARFGSECSSEIICAKRDSHEGQSAATAVIARRPMADRARDLVGKILGSVQALSSRSPRSSTLH